MRFFIQGGKQRSLERYAALQSLTDYDYYNTVEKLPEEKQKARFFQNEMDFAFFAAQLGWSRSDWEQTTAVERMFIRKELEKKTVEQSNLLVNVVQVAVSNVHNKRKRKLWVRKRKKAALPISRKEIGAIQEQLKKPAPWTPWQRKEVTNG